MALINRYNPNDAKRITEKILPNEETRSKFIEFLANAIKYTNTLQNDNWNLNLDQNGNFIRFNVGQQYCIDLNKNRLQILCNKLTIGPIVEREMIPVIFRGHIKNKRIDCHRMDEVPDCLAKTKNSVGCILNHKDIKQYIAFFKKGNKVFIRDALKTKLLPKMRDAHSIGAVEYIFSFSESNDPIEYPDYFEFIEIEKEKIKEAQHLSQAERKIILKQSRRKPTKTIIQHAVLNRNPYVVAEVLYRAKGICEKCRKPAPFIRETGDTPYLEVHHIITLAEGGDDTIENAVALCPNCHRKEHYGKKNAT